MAQLSADQRNYFYLLEAERTGIHKPILAALYIAHGSPTLTDGEVGLGIFPINRIPLDQVNTFPEQVQYAANTIRSMTDRLTAQGWRGDEIWNPDLGRYTDRFLQTIAEGYSPPATDQDGALLEATRSAVLIEAYLEDLTLDYSAEELPQNLSYLDGALLTLTERIPRYYAGLPHQREALIETLRIWRKLNSRDAVLTALKDMPPLGADGAVLDDTAIDRKLIQFLYNVARYYGGYPHQREALIRMTQLWRQLDSREEAIASLRQSNSADTNISIVDPALVAFAQRIPSFYQGKGEQRNALTEGFRLWRGLDSRASALIALGINPQIFSSSDTDQQQLADVAAQLDRQLVEFLKRVPGSYTEQERQREALIRMVQLWRGLDSREKALQSLLDDVRRMAAARRDSPDAAPRPEPITPAPRPSQWTPRNIQLYASIIPNGSFTWADATHGGTRMPPDQTTVNAIIRIARMAQEARDRIGRPFRITSWYRPPEVNRQVGGASASRHIVGDAIDFYCDGLTGDQLYWALDPWWPGGLGRYTNFPYLSHLDARGYRARWRH
jgi:hypothetical protein